MRTVYLLSWCIHNIYRMLFICTYVFPCIPDVRGYVSLDVVPHLSAPQVLGSYNTALLPNSCFSMLQDPSVGSENYAGIQFESFKVSNKVKYNVLTQEKNDLVTPF